MEESGEASRVSKPIVPKFSSFKPKSSSTAPPPTTLVSSDKTGPGPAVEEEKKSFDRKSCHHRSHSRERRHRSRSTERHSRSRRERRDRSRERRHRSKSRDRKREHHKLSSKYEQSEVRDLEIYKNRDTDIQIAPWEDEQELWVIDRKGDYSNLRYGGLHRYSVPDYRRSGYGSVLGLDARFRIDRSFTTEREVIISDYYQSHAPDRSAFSKLQKFEKRTLRLVKPLAQDSTIESRLEFIPLHSRKRKRDAEPPASDDEQTHYRSIEGKAKPNDRPVDPDTVFESEMSDSDLDIAPYDPEAELKQKNIELSRRTREEPENVEGWMELIDHQETLVSLGRNLVKGHLTGSERRNLAEVRVSIYEEALRRIKGKQQDRSQLMIGMMREGAIIWDFKKLGDKWESLLKENPHIGQLWVKYLNFVQTSFLQFRFEKCKQVFQRSLSAVEQACRSAGPGTTLYDELVDIQFYIFTRMTLMIHQAGYQEHAHALWQGILEYYLFRPKKANMAMSKAELLKSFEEFWESEAPRVGEPNAVGWERSLEDEVPAPEPLDTQVDISDIKDNIFRSFTKLETKCESRMRFPARTFDNTIEDDPYRIILFSDLQDVLSTLPLQAPKLVVVEAFLRFAQLPPLANVGKARNDSWRLDMFLRDETLLPRNNSTTSDGASDGYTPRFKAYSTFEMQSFPVTSELLLQGTFSHSKNSHDELEYLKSALMQIANVSDDDRIIEHYLCFIKHHWPAEASKLSKSFIKKRPSSLRLYNIYAINEADNGNIEASNRVFSTAIGMSATLPQRNQSDIIILWRSWLWEAFKIGDYSQAMYRLLSLGEGTPSSNPPTDWSIKDGTPAAVLKTKRALIEGRDHLLSNEQYTLAVLYSECLALLAYLQNQHKVDAALDVFDQTSAILTARKLGYSPANELNHQARARFFSIHISQTSTYKPAMLRQKLEESISLFPNNTIFLSMYLANEAHLRIDDRVRTLLRDVVLSPSSASTVGWLFAAFAEMARPLAAGATAHPIRAAFERAAKDESIPHSPSLWRAYLLYELSLDPSSSRAKEVFLRGVTHLPWCKKYMMLAFSLPELRGRLTSAELQGVYSTMMEKELRVHVDLTEALERKQERRENKSR